MGALGLMALVVAGCRRETTSGGPTRGRDSTDAATALPFSTRTLLATVPDPGDAFRARWHVIVAPDRRWVALAVRLLAVQVGGRERRGWPAVEGYRDKIWSDRAFVMVGARRGPDLRMVVGPVASPDGRRVAYFGMMMGEQESGGWRLFVVDTAGEHRPGERFDDVREGSLIWSPDGQRLAFAARLGSGWFVSVGAKRGPFFDGGVSAPVFGAHPEQPAYVGRRHGRQILVYGDDEVGELDDGVPVVDRALATHPDGRRFGYHSSRPTVPSELRKSFLEHLALADRRGPTFVAFPGAPVFSGDGRHVAYTVDRPTIGGPSATEVVLDGAPIARRRWIHSLAFTPDGRLAYVAEHGREQRLVVGGRAGALIDFDRLEWPGLHPGEGVINLFPEPSWTSGGFTFDRQGRHVALAAGKDGKWVVVLDDRPGPVHQWVGTPVFSADGRKLGYPARKGRELWWEVMDVPPVDPVRQRM